MGFAKKTCKCKHAVVCMFSALALTTACVDTASTTQEFRHIDHRLWYAEDTVTLSVTPIGKTGLYAERYMLRTDHNYPYEELFLKVEHRLASPDMTLCDTVCLHPVDSSAGTYLLQYVSQPKELHLVNGQHGEICVTHLMHRNPLPAISDVGVSVLPANQVGNNRWDFLKSIIH